MNQSTMSQHCFVDELPSAPDFVGRELQLQQLNEFWEAKAGVVSLIGLGGAGKTALLSRFLEGLLQEPLDVRVFVWSFYNDPDTNAFLKTAVEFVTGKDAIHAAGTGWFYVLKQALESDRRYLFVLDGLERVQRPVTDAKGMYGELEDPLLRGFLLRMATDESKSQAIITSRFPITDLESRSVEHYRVVDVDQLDLPTALSLLHLRHINGSTMAMEALVDLSGGHALSLDILAAAVSEFFGGDADGFPADVAASLSADPSQASRLLAVLMMVGESLDIRQRDLMNRLCVFRFGVTLEDLLSVLGIGEESAASLSHIENLQLEVLVESLIRLRLVNCEAAGKYSVHPAVRDYFYRLFRDSSATHSAIADHLLSLSDRPGIGMPTDKDSLDRLEELFHHALTAGRQRDALDIYVTRMGGNEHLNVTLGDYARTYRLLSAFPDCPDSGGIYFCHRSFGQFDEALRARPQNRYIRIAQGRLRELADDPNPHTRAAVRFLLGEPVAIPERLADFPLSGAHLRIFKGDLIDAERCAERDLAMSMFQDDVIRARLAKGEVCRLRGRYEESALCLEDAGTWALRSSSSEHLALLFLHRGSLCTDQNLLGEAKGSFGEALQIARDADFKLFECLILAEQARFFFKAREFEASLACAEAAAEIAGPTQTGFIWGEAGALRIFSEAARALNDSVGSAKSLRRLIQIQNALNDASVSGTVRTLSQVEGRTSLTDTEGLPSPSPEQRTLRTSVESPV